MSVRSIARAGAMSIVLWLSGSGYAAPPNGEGSDSKEVDFGKRRLDLSLPDIPAASALGVSTDKVSRPSSVRELAVGVSNGFLPNGQFGQSIALEVSPAALVDSSSELARRWRISIATVATKEKGQGAAAETTVGKLAVGVRWTLGGYDAAKDEKLVGCILRGMADASAREASQSPPSPDPKVSAAIPGQRPTRNNTSARVCREIARATNRIPLALDVAGLAVGTTTGAAELSNLTSWSNTFWLSFSVPFSSKKVTKLAIHEFAMNGKKEKREVYDSAAGPAGVLSGPAVGLTGMVRWNNGVSGDAVATADALKEIFAGLRLPFIWDSYGFFVEAGVIGRYHGCPRAWESSSYYGGGFEVRLGNGSWLSLYAGNAGGATGTVGTGFNALAGFRWTFGEDRAFGN